jgi:Mg-chelatase subunit ChlD
MNADRLLDAVAVSAAVLGSVTLLGHGDPTAGAPGGRQTLADAGACRGIITTSLSAREVRMCDPVTVTNQAEATCTGCADGLNVVLLMQTEPCCQSAPWQVQAAGETLERLRRELPFTKIKVGVVHYNDDSAKITLGLTDIGQGGAIRGAISKTHMGPQLSGAFVAAGNQALRVLAEGRRTAGGASIEPCELAVLFAYNTEFGMPDSAAWLAAGAEMKKAASLLARSDVTLVGICTTASLPGPDAGACQHVKEIALAAGGWFAAYNVGSPSAEVVEAARQAGRSSPMDLLSLVNSIPEDLEYEAGSGGPPPQGVDAGVRQTRLRWLWHEPGATGAHTVTYAVKPLAEGTWPITGTLAITDTLGRSRIVPAGPVTITVSGLCETPTAPAIPSSTASATATPSEPPAETPTSTLTPTATATAVPRALFLPLVLTERCDPQHKRADVALVIDTSSSMAGKKLEDAKAAAAMFVGQMDLVPGRDQVAVVRYDTQAELVCQLTNARAVVDAAIRNLSSRVGTHIDAGLRTALAELQGPRHLERNTSVMILLTDGIQTGTPGEEVRAAAEVRAAGVRLYTIGLGADVDAATLREMAGDASRYRFAPDSADLARIYAEIASDILCPAPSKGFWPGS